MTKHRWGPWDQDGWETESGAWYRSKWAHRTCIDCGEYDSVKLKSPCDVRG